MNARERGAALLLVLWAIVLLAALLAGIAVASRSHGEAALRGSEHVRAQLAAEAGLAHAVTGLRAPDPRRHWIPDGRPYIFAFDGAKVTTRVVDASGMLDLNASSPDLLQRLFTAAGADPSRARRLAGAIVDWRGDNPGGALPVGRYVPAAKPAHGPLRTIAALSHMPGMDADLYARVARAVTVFSGRNFPDAAYAGPLVLAALRNVDVTEVKTLVSERRARPARRRGFGNTGAFSGEPAEVLVAGYGGTVERVFSSAVMPDGTRAELDVTLRLMPAIGNAQPYQVLGWRADSARPVNRLR